MVNKNETKNTNTGVGDQIVYGMTTFSTCTCTCTPVHVHLYRLYEDL